MSPARCWLRFTATSRTDWWSWQQPLEGGEVERELSQRATTAVPDAQIYCCSAPDKRPTDGWKRPIPSAKAVPMAEPALPLPVLCGVAGAATSLFLFNTRRGGELHR